MSSASPPRSSIPLVLLLNPAQPDPFPEVFEYQALEFRAQALTGEELELMVDRRPLEALMRPGSALWFWRWNPAAASGVHQVVLRVGERQFRWQLRVIPRKLDLERYEALIEDLQRLCHNLVYSLGGAGEEGVALQPNPEWERSRLEEYYVLLTTQLDALERAVRAIATRPRETLRTQQVDQHLGQVTALDATVLAGPPPEDLEPAPPELAADFQAALSPSGRLPRMLPQRQSVASYDIYEHQLLKTLLTLLLRRAHAIQRLAATEAERLERNLELSGSGATRLERAHQIVIGSQRSEHRLRELRSLPFLSEVGPLSAPRGATPLLQREPHYRTVYRVWQALRAHPLVRFDSPLLRLPLNELPRLYESWCVLMVAETLLSLGWQIQQQQLITRPAADDESLSPNVMLTEHMPLLVLTRDDCQLQLRYQPVYRPAQRGSLRSLDSQNHVPDIAIEVSVSGQPPWLIILDAKYRRDGEGLPADAIADGYVYLGAIGDRQQRRVRAALLLYPSAGEAKLFESGVGLVPAQPGNLEALQNVLRQLLQTNE